MFDAAPRGLCCAALGAGLLLAAGPAAADWPHGPRPDRVEAPVSKAHDIPRYKDTATDPAGDTFGTGAVQLDLNRLTAEVVGSDLVVSLAFVGAVSAPDSGRADALDGFIDLDLDQNGATGDVPWTDLFRPDDGSTGMGNEAYVDLTSYDTSGNVELIDDATDAVLGLVPLTFGDRSARVHLPLNLLGGDRSVDVAAVVGSLEEATDIAPNQGSVASSDGLGPVLLQDDRFRVEVEWGDFEGNAGLGRVVEQSEDSAVFYFFGPRNWELLVKVLDGCPVNDRFWLFLAGATNVEYTVTVTDTQTGARQERRNPLGQTALTLTDTDAFATCP